MRKEKEKEPYHSKAYHRFFEGYAERRIYDEKSGMRIERTYVGCYYRRKFSDQKDTLYRILYGALYAAGIVSFLYAGTRDTGAGLVWYTALPVAFGLVATLWLALPICFNLTAKRKMIVRRYRDSSEDLIRASLTAAIMQLLNTVACLASILLVPEQNIMQAWLCVMFFFVSCAVFTVIFLLEQNIVYERIPSGNEIPHGASIIKFRNNF